jgi:hypothetical protein
VADGQVLDAFPERQRAMNEMVKAVGEFKLKAAQAELTEAVAADQATRTYMLQVVVGQLQKDLATVNAQGTSANLKVSNLASRVQAANMLLRGTEIAAYSHAKDAYKFFEKLAIIEGDESLFSTVFDPKSIKGKDFLNNRDPSKPCEGPPTDEKEMNALQLMDFALGKQYIARTGSSAQRQFVRLFKEIQKVADNSVAAIRQHTDAVRKSVFDAWTPVRILGVEPTPAEKRILESTGPKAAG